MKKFKKIAGIAGGLAVLGGGAAIIAACKTNDDKDKTDAQKALEAVVVSGKQKDIKWTDSKNGTFTATNFTDAAWGIFSSEYAAVTGVDAKAVNGVRKALATASSVDFTAAPTSEVAGLTLATAPSAIATTTSSVDITIKSGDTSLKITVKKSTTVTKNGGQTEIESLLATAPTIQWTAASGTTPASGNLALDLNLTTAEATALVTELKKVAAVTPANGNAQLKIIVDALNAPAATDPFKTTALPTTALLSETPTAIPAATTAFADKATYSFKVASGTGATGATLTITVTFTVA